MKSQRHETGGEGTRRDGTGAGWDGDGTGRDWRGGTTVDPGGGERARD